MNIPKLIKEARQHVIDKGFYTPTNNIGELLMMIVSELGEALEAHRNNRFANWKAFNKIKNECEFNLKSIPEEKIKFKKEEAFSLCIKDTFEDEIADVFIRLFSLCGYLGIIFEYKKDYGVSGIDENIPSCLLHSCKLFIDSEYHHDIDRSHYLQKAYSYLIDFCKHHEIDIEKHIIAKMEYNKTRPHKHGKEY